MFLGLMVETYYDEQAKTPSALRPKLIIGKMHKIPVFLV